jgi:hypothetical protein
MFGAATRGLTGRTLRCRFRTFGVREAETRESIALGAVGKREGYGSQRGSYLGRTCPAQLDHYSKLIN